MNVQAIINAYLHYESMCDHSYDFSCNLCGYHPTTLVMDLNKKVAFDCPFSELELPDDYDINNTDTVDCYTFWNNVELGMVLRGFPQRKVPEYNVKPDLMQWSPFIGTNTRRGSLVLNTEHRKVNKQNGELEGDCREITEERLVELLQHSSRNEVESFAKSLGSKAKGTKADMLSQIRLPYLKDNDKFKKAFSKLWGTIWRMGVRDLYSWRHILFEIRPSSRKPTRLHRPITVNETSTKHCCV